MRPQILNPLFATVTSIVGVGAKTTGLLEKLCGGVRVVDLLYHVPVNIIQRKLNPSLHSVRSGDIIITTVTVEQHKSPANKRQPLRILCYNETGYLTIVLFRQHKNYIENCYKIGSRIAIAGKVDRFSGELQIHHPDYSVPTDRIGGIKEVENVYPLVVGISNKQVHGLIGNSLMKTPVLGEWTDKTLLEQENWLDWRESLTKLHNPVDVQDIDVNSRYVRRLAYDEFLANCLAMKIIKQKISNVSGNCNKDGDELRNDLLSRLHFELTKCQKKVLEEIDVDMQSSNRMLRLLQGDVGSGKTIVALLAGLSVVEMGGQVAFVAPLSILAEQHFTTISSLLPNVKVCLLTGKTKGKERKKLLEELKDGEIDIIIGTHALFQSDVEFKQLNFIVIDEQHRFGVKQRVEMVRKGHKPDILLMSATPIPRTLMLSAYSDMDISILDEKPLNRLEIDTRMISDSKIDKVREGVMRTLQKNEKVYWICPLVEESENLDITNVQDRYAEFRKIFGDDNVLMIHGKMKPEEKEKVMAEFKGSGTAKILIATTVIEVGVDVRDATVMVIEHAERYGLSQLHQLRGRVGRGDKQSYCMLLHGEDMSQSTAQRLSTIRDTNNGFEIAEEDLKMRGSGEVLGTKQSGVPQYKIANLYAHYDLLNKANRNADMILNDNPALEGEDGEIIRNLLYLFEYDQCVRMICGG